MCNAKISVSALKVAFLLFVLLPGADAVFGRETRASVCGTVCLSVGRHAKSSDLLQIKTRMFLDGPSIASLYFRSWKVKASKLKVKDAKIEKNAEIVFGPDSIADSPINFKYTAQYFSSGGGYAYCVWLTLQICFVVVVIN